MKILNIIDVWGWAFEFAARGWAKYSRHQVDWVPASEVTKAQMSEYDVFFVSTRNAESMRFPLPLDRTVAAIHSMNPLAFSELPRYKAIIGVSKQICGQAVMRFCNLKVQYLRNAVDGEVFKPTLKLGRYIGWAGDRRRKCKRSHLLLKLNIPTNLIKIKSDWGKQFFVKGRNQDDQVQFLQSLYCYIQPSDTEGMSLATLEAAACGLPILATDVGDTKRIIPKEWLLPVPEAKCLQRMNVLLATLMKDREVAIRAGTHNWGMFNFEGWCWSKRAKEYDDFFSETFGKE